LRKKKKSGEKENTSLEQRNKNKILPIVWKAIIGSKKNG
jgi:hypothetical protein